MGGVNASGGGGGLRTGGGAGGFAAIGFSRFFFIPVFCFVVQVRSRMNTVPERRGFPLSASR